MKSISKYGLVAAGWIYRFPDERNVCGGIDDNHAACLFLLGLKIRTRDLDEIGQHADYT